MTTRALHVHARHLETLDEQRRIAIGDVQLVLEPLTFEDWDALPAQAVDGLGEGDSVVVSSLSVLGPALHEQVAAAARIIAAGVGLVAVADQLDTALDATLARALTLIAAADAAASLAQAKRVIAAARLRSAVTPSKAEFVPVEFADLAPSLE